MGAVISIHTRMRMIQKVSVYITPGAGNGSGKHSCLRIRGVRSVIRQGFIQWRLNVIISSHIEEIQ
jgi:hypothetical protein